MMSFKANGDVTMTKVMNQGACEMNQAACEMTADELALVSGGGNLGPAAKAEGFEPMSILGTLGAAFLSGFGGGVS
jgi:hypothetical protein